MQLEDSIDGSRRRRGTLGQRALLGLLGGLLALLLGWLLGFVVRDVDRLEGPRYETFERRLVGDERMERLTALARERDELLRRIGRQHEVQGHLERSAASARGTMEQLLDVHRLQLEKAVEPTEAEQRALAEGERLFLEAQASFQAANASIAALDEERVRTEEAVRRLEEELAPLREQAQREFQEAFRGHRIRVAALKLGILLPILALSVWLVLARRRSPYRILALALLFAASWRVGWVIHEHFPTEVFKYIATGTGIAVVVAAITVLVRRAVTPPREVLLHQNREAYRRHLCPVCAEPILRGPLRWARWSRNGPRELVGRREEPGAEAERPYVCPSCGTTLFARCEVCRAIRHTLLPYCESCGTAREIGAPPPPPAEPAF